MHDAPFGTLCRLGHAPAVTPRAHNLRFRVFWILLDLDELDRLPRTVRLFSYNRLNAVSFHDADHGDGSTTPLRRQIDRHLA